MASLSISLTVEDRFSAMDFYKEAFGAEILYQLGSPETDLAEPEDQWGGNRAATVVDPSSDRWGLSHLIEQASDEKLNRRAMKQFGGGAE
ncbi:MAG: hypothetical protein ACN4GG_08635 [Akkermansiaceae bacterium]